MKKTIKIIAVLALFSMGFAACKKEKQTSQTQQQVKYEVTTNGDINTEIFVSYIGRNNPFGGYNLYDATSLSETTTTPWSYEYLTNCEKTIALLYIQVLNNTETTVNAKMFIDGVLVEEKTGNYIELYHRID